jgi:energy-coupling factor transport system ATP-binding protein
MAKNAAVEVRNLDFTYEEGPQILHGVNFSLPQGSLTAVIGLSGCGKSTLCHCLCGIIPQALGGELHGKILLQGQDISGIPLAQLSQTIGLVMQNPDLQLVTTTVEDELSFAPENLCLPPAEIAQRVERVLERLHFEHLRLASPHDLSGGQKRLLAIGAVLTLEPQILVLDEPMSHLDQQGKLLMKDALLALLEEGRTIIMVEHDWEIALFADNWLVMAEGRLLNFGPPDDILQNKDFLRHHNLL